MAEGWLRHLGGDCFLARSVGPRPSHLHPLATAAMQEVEIDIASQRGKGFDALQSERFDVVVTLCEESAADLPALPGRPTVRHHPTDDPTWIEDEFGADINEFRKVRDALRDVVAALVAGG